MMITLYLLALLIAPQPSVASHAQGAAIKIANATTYDLTFDKGRVSGCTVTATSGNPHVDRFICDAARVCGNKNSDEARREVCIASKREELASMIAKKLSGAK